MKRYFGGDKATRGMYLNLRSGEFVDFGEPEAILPGTGLDKYARVPRLLPFVAGPIFGLLFTLSLPFLGVAGLVSGSLAKARVVPGFQRLIGHRHTLAVK